MQKYWISEKDKDRFPSSKERKRERKKNGRGNEMARGRKVVSAERR